MIKSVIFDMDGVLVDSEPIYLNFDLDFAREKNPNVQLEDLVGMVGATKEDAWSVMERAVHNGQSWQELRQEFKQRDIYSHVNYREIFRPEARDLLALLQNKGYHIALASSAHMEIILQILEENDIRNYFDVILSGEQFKKSKPDPEIYLEAARRLNNLPVECLVVEDSIIGITAALRAGMNVAALRDEHFGLDQSMAHHVLSSLSEVSRLLGI